MMSACTFSCDVNSSALQACMYCFPEIAGTQAAEMHRLISDTRACRAGVYTSNYWCSACQNRFNAGAPAGHTYRGVPALHLQYQVAAYPADSPRPPAK